MDILNIENCTIRYQEQEAAVEHVSLSVGEQEIVSIVGESGSGKTTLIRAILGILPPGGTVTEGKILFQGKNILELDETSLQKLRGTEIAMIFQDVGASLDPIRIVESQYRESILAHRKMAKADCRSLEKAMLAKMHLTDPERVMVSYPFELSGGMKQRVGIAMSMTARPRLLLADEPTSALDVTIQAEILKLLKKLQKELNLSILFITHDLGVVAQIADRVAVMQDGNIVELEEAKQLFTAPKHSYTKKLLHDHPYYMHRNESKLISESELHEKLVEISHLSYFYPLDRKRVFQAVKDVSFEIRRDEIFGLVGESGSGKSTVGKCLMGILSPEAETFSYEGINLLDKKAKKKNARRLQKERQMIFQDSTSSLNQKMKVEKILAEPLEIHKVFSDKKEQHDFLCEMMEEVELQEEQLHVWPPELSGGQRQRVAIARAFAMKPKLLIADEPIASLDVTTQAQMVKLFRHLQREHDCAILFIAHDLSMVRLLCDRVGVMKDGKLVEIGETEQVFEHPQHLYTKKLLEAIPIPEISGEEQSDEETMA